MPVTTATAWYGNAASNSYLNLLAKFHEFVSTACDLHTVVGYDFASFGNFVSPWLLIRNESAGYRIFLFSGTISPFHGVFALLDPTDTIDVPSPSTGTPSSYASNYPLTSGFVNVIGGYYASDTGVLVHAAEYSDAILFAVKAASQEHWQSGIHAGKIYVPFNASDPALGIDGYGIMGGSPLVRNNSIAINHWFGGYNSSTYPNFSKVKVGSDVWRAPYLAASWPDCDDSSTTLTDDLNSNVRLIPVAIQAVSPTNVTTGLVGYTKYIRLYKSIGGHGAVINASDASDQAWFRFSGENANSRSCILWSKTPVDGGTTTSEAGGSFNNGAGGMFP